ncbi:PP0621 family protein [Burkholderia vietnamiensis]|uniref:PP0621 family protein n=2 Tax=Burkholderia vietnamiensis TaxID=60552 RepID=UPI003B968FEC
MFPRNRRIRDASSARGSSRSAGERRLRRRPGRPGADTRSLPEPMVRCAECGVHTPKGDAVAGGGEYFCSAEHAQRHRARASDTDAR